MIRRLLIAIALMSVMDIAIGLQALPAPQGGGECSDQSGQEVRCPDGKYHDHYTGKEQPDTCDNFKTGSAKVHDCDCERTKMEKDQCDAPPTPGQKCKTECREHACKCQSMECS
jgi:hypothetical protein